MKVINRKEYGLRKKDLGIDWTVGYLSVDVCDGRVWAYECEPSTSKGFGGYHRLIKGGTVLIDMTWPFGDETIVRVVKETLK